jgi:hypothetical protein
MRRLHQSTFAMTEELHGQLQQPMPPFCAAAGLRFGESDEQNGHWRNYFIGVVGDVDAEEADVLWPNQARLRLHPSPPSSACRPHSSKPPASYDLTPHHACAAGVECKKP